MTHRPLVGCWLASLIWVASAGSLPGSPARQSQAAAAPDIITAARSLVGQAEHSKAVAQLDPLILELRPLARTDPQARAYFVDALETRVRALVGLDNLQAAAADARELFAVRPDYQPPEFNRQVKRILTEARQAVVGDVQVVVTPADASIEIDSVRIDKGPKLVPLSKGLHQLRVTKPYYQEELRSIAVEAGINPPIEVKLTRIWAAVSLATVPAGVMVMVDGVEKGRTEAGSGEPTQQWEDRAREIGVRSSELSRPFVVGELGIGSHAFAFHFDCYKDRTLTLAVDALEDYWYAVKLEPATGSVTVDSPTKDAIVFLDGASKGRVPFTGSICEGRHIIDVRTAYGRYWREVNVRPGDAIDLDARPKPVFGLLSTTGMPSGVRGASDLRVELAKRLARASSIGFMALPASEVDKELSTEQLEPGWLDYDLARKPSSAAARRIKSGRAELSAGLARAFQVHGVAEVHQLKDEVPRSVRVSLLAAGSEVPDVFEVALDDEASVQHVVDQLDASPRLFSPTIGVTVIDVLDVKGPAVVGVEPDGAAARAGLAKGDVITAVGGRAVSRAAEIAEALRERGDGEPVVVAWRDRTGAPKQGEVEVSRIPQVIASGDATLPFNKVILQLQYQLTTVPPGSLDESVIRLNLGVAWRSVGNNEAALDQLRQVRLPQGPGVSQGTVQYHLGRCYEALDQLPQAIEAYTLAIAAKDATETEDGRLISELVGQAYVEKLRQRLPK